MLRMDKICVIRHKVLVEGKSIRCVAGELGVSRNTVTKYLTLPEALRKEREPRLRPVMDKVGPRIDEILEEWKHRVSRVPRSGVGGTGKESGHCVIIIGIGEDNDDGGDGSDRRKHGPCGVSAQAGRRA